MKLFLFLKPSWRKLLYLTQGFLTVSFYNKYLLRCTVKPYTVFLEREATAVLVTEEITRKSIVGIFNIYTETKPTQTKCPT